MELLKKEKSWFLSEEGAKKFLALSLLEERIMFIYSYLKEVANECFEKNNTLFKMAFFFADAVYNSNERYAKYPELLCTKANPFMTFLDKADKYYSAEKMYLILTAILNRKVDPGNRDEWIYNEQYLNASDLMDKLEDVGLNYLPSNSMDMVNPDIYEMDQTICFLQLELVWLFLKS